MNDKPYLLLEKKMRDLLAYINIMTKQFPKHEKYLMANKLREYGYEIFELIIICGKKLHKKTESLVYLIQRILNNNPEIRPEIAGWYINNRR